MLNNIKIMQISMNQRLRIIVEKFGQNEQKNLAMQIGIGERTFSNYLNNETRIPLSVFETIKKTFPQINSDWLLLGEGEMLKPNFNNDDIPKFYTQSEKNEVKGNKNISTFGEDSPIYMSKDDIIQSLQFTIKTMNELLKARENEIEQLKKELEVNK